MIPLHRIGFQANLVDTGKSRLAGGKQCRADEQRQYRYEIDHVCFLSVSKANHDYYNIKREKLQV